MYTCIDKTMQIVLERGSIDGMPNTYACIGVSNPNVPIFPPRVCTLVLFIIVVTVVVPRVCVPVRSFLPPRASRPRNIGKLMYMFTVARKTLL